MKREYVDGYRIIADRAVERRMPDGRTFQVFRDGASEAEARRVLARLK